MTVEGPDRGYSWVIVFCCGYIHFAIFGLFRSWGVIYVAVINEYHVSREEASWPFSLCSAVFQLVGPAVSIITHYISQRSTCLLGSTIATIGVIGCYFAENVMWITISYGVVHGLGFGIIVTLIPVFLNQYFVKYRASAMGIAFSGGSISSFVVPIVMEWLLDNYGLRGSFLLLGGLAMNTLVASALIRPPPWLKKTPATSLKLKEDSEAKDSGVSTSGEVKGQITLTVECERQDDFRDSVFVDKDKEDADTSIVESLQLDLPSTEEVVSEKQDTVVSNNDSMLFEDTVSKIYSVNDSSNFYKSSTENAVDKNYLEVQEPLMNGQPVYIKPKNIKHEKRKHKLNCDAHLSIVEILKNPMFHLIAYSMFIFFVALQSFFVVIVDYAKDKGIPETEGVYLMSIFSLTDLCGRSGLGWITDRNYVKRKNMVIFNFFAISIIMQLYPVINDFAGLMAVAAFHGISAGSCITLFFVLQAEYLGIKRLTLVVGLTSFITGVLTLLRPAMIGVFRDTIGSYDWMFHSLGLASFFFCVSMAS